jgi:MFS transporter, PPP family, 3-phenylpropionic acid transporter
VTLALQASLLVFTATWIIRVPNYLAMPRGSRNPAEEGMLFELLRLRAFRQVVLVAALVLGSHALHDSFAVIYWTSAGIGPALLGWIGPARALTISAAIGAIRWALSATSTDPYVLACIEPLHGATFALLHLASMRVIAEVTPPRLAATAQSVYGTLGIGAAVTILTFASGVLYQHLGGRGFWVMSALRVVAIPIAMRLQVRV